MAGGVDDVLGKGLAHEACRVFPIVLNKSKVRKLKTLMKLKISKAVKTKLLFNSLITL